MRVIMDNQIAANKAAAKAMAFELVLAKKALIKSWAAKLFWKTRPVISLAKAVAMATERYDQEIKQND